MERNDDNSFPADFVWGAATAAYQIEGAANEDGRGESVWDRFCATPGKVRNGDTGAIACDFYHRYPEDIELMRELGLDAFRFSIAWPRILPEGRGRVNRRGLDFYDRLVDALLAARDRAVRDALPLGHCRRRSRTRAAGRRARRPRRSSSTSRSSPTGSATASRTGSRTTSRGSCAWLGHCVGRARAGPTSEADAVAAAHHLLLSHGWAVEVLRRDAPGRAGRDRAQPRPRRTLPRRLAREADAPRASVDGMAQPLVPRPDLPRRYPDDMLEAEFAPPVRDGDLATIAAPLDFLGVNNYFRAVVAARRERRPLAARAAGDATLTDMGWEVYPKALHELLVRVAREYAPPAIYVTENGAAFGDVRGHDGRVHDPERQDYLEQHLDGGPRGRSRTACRCAGYFAGRCSTTSSGPRATAKRFGLVYVDYPTLERVPKASFYWYRDFIASRKPAIA